VEPTGAAIAERAGVALRSIAQHFPTREDLLRALAERHLARLPKPEVLEGPFDERLARFVEARARVLESSVAMRRVGLSAAGRSKAIDAAFAQVAKARRRELESTFAAELTGRPSWVLEALDALMSGVTWDTLRGPQGLSARAAREVLLQAGRRLLVT
jgi:AcrR family transcriptional regulator